MCFKDIVPKPYKEFKDIFAKESFDKLPNCKKATFHSSLYLILTVDVSPLDVQFGEVLRSSS